MKELLLEPFLSLKEPVYNLENIEKINDCRLGAVNGANNLDQGGQQITFSKPRDGTLVRLADSYLEVTFIYNTQTLAGAPGTVGVAADGADITFENDLISKMFDTVELSIGGTPIETVSWSNVATELVGLVVYSSDEDRASGASFGWISDYGAGAPEISPGTFSAAMITALNAALPELAVAAPVAPIVVGTVTAGAAAITNPTIMTSIYNSVNALVLAG